jgi:hypothetical protein
MDDYRDTFTIISDFDESLLFVDLDLNSVHFLVTLIIVSRIHKYFVEYFVECRYILHLL